MSFEGFDELNARFTEALESIEIGRTQKVVTLIIDEVQAQAATMTPIGKTSNLINSAYANLERTSSGWRGEVGYGAEYAFAVHEMPGKLVGTGQAWNPDAEPKFLEKAVRNVMANDLQGIIDSQYRL